MSTPEGAGEKRRGFDLIHCNRWCSRKGREAPERTILPPKGWWCPRKGDDAPEGRWSPRKDGEAPERAMMPRKGRCCPQTGGEVPKRVQWCWPERTVPKDGILEPSINLYRLLRVTISRLARTRVTRAVVNPIIKETTSQNESQVILGGLHILQFSPSIKLLRPDWQCLVWL